MKQLKLEFHKEALKFLYVVLSQRRYLNRQGLGKKDRLKMINDVQFLELHLDANNYNSDQAMAGFLIRHQERVRSIIPGQPSKANIPQTESFEKLLARARSLALKVKPIPNQLTINSI